MLRGIALALVLHKNTLVARLDVSVTTIYDLDRFGYCNIGALHKDSFYFWTAYH